MMNNKYEAWMNNDGTAYRLFETLLSGHQTLRAGIRLIEGKGWHVVPNSQFRKPSRKAFESAVDAARATYGAQAAEAIQNPRHDSEVQ